MKNNDYNRSYRTWKKRLTVTACVLHRVITIGGLSVQLNRSLSSTTPATPVIITSYRDRDIFQISKPPYPPAINNPFPSTLPLVRTPPSCDSPTAKTPTASPRGTEPRFMDRSPDNRSLTSRENAPSPVYRPSLSPVFDAAATADSGLGANVVSYRFRALTPPPRETVSAAPGGTNRFSNDNYY